MEVSPEDLKLPQSVVARLIKESLPDGAIVSKEAKVAIARAAAIFVLHATTFASENAQSRKRKNITAEDVMHAIKALECEELENPVKEALEAFRNQKEQRIQQKKSMNTVNKNTTDDQMEESTSATSDGIQIVTTDQQQDETLNTDQDNEYNAD